MFTLRNPKPTCHSSNLNQEHNDGFLHYLTSTPLDLDQHIPRYQSKPNVWSVLTLPDSANVAQAFAKLAAEGFSSAPVVDWRGDYKGFFSMLDVVKLVSTIMWWLTPKDKKKAKNMQKEQNKARMLECEEKFESALVSAVMDKGAGSGCPPLCKNSSTFDALELLGGGGISRVAVVDQGALVGMMTQSMLISEISQRMSLVHSDLRNMRAVSLLVKDAPFYRVQQTDAAVTAFHLMTTHEVNGVAVVDRNENLVDNISARDIRGMTTLQDVFISAKEFKQKVRAMSQKTETKKKTTMSPETKTTTMKPTYYTKKTIPTEIKMETSFSPSVPVCVNTTATFEDVVVAMRGGKLHRVYVVHTFTPTKAVGVLTQTDILRCMFQFYTEI